MKLTIDYNDKNNTPKGKIIYFSGDNLSSIINSYKNISPYIASHRKLEITIFFIKVEIQINKLIRKLVYIIFEEIGNLHDYLKTLNDYTKMSSLRCLIKVSNIKEVKENFQYTPRNFYYEEDIFIPASKNRQLCATDYNKEITIFIPFLNFPEYKIIDKI